MTTPSTRPARHRGLLALLAATAVTAPLVAAPAEAARSFKPCAREDGPGPCVWDAKHRGNGIGHSFILRRDGRVVYISHGRARWISR